MDFLQSVVLVLIVVLFFAALASGAGKHVATDPVPEELSCLDR